ncbi:Fe-S-containing hydro-lyase [Sporosalibacterium faouarense]|uniref:Fe-S-containing hydro-lyase n=1 Tax=Sporosalibacterium faouarense TaxID=516123 RepID=UPI00141C315E|nr:Fe-S-containing hydro-lyase [Sporosalibacterium faouarense]MTI48803.1 Fe-S-containing hydro-lyase [Bacillota bacterium]
MSEIKIETPLNLDKIKDLKAGDRVYLTGTIYTARDAAHERLVNQIENKENVPFKIQNATIYYVGPCPAKPGEVIGSAGPTTSYRMDKYTPLLLDKGLKGMIGKGLRNEKVIDSMIENKAIYFAAIGGAGALISSCIKESRIIAYPELGAEAIRELYVENFPLIVAIDSKGNNLYNR